MFVKKLKGIIPLADVFSEGLIQLTVSHKKKK